MWVARGQWFGGDGRAMAEVGAAEFGERCEIVDDFGLGIDGLIRHFRAQAFDSLVVFDGAAVLAIGIDLITDEKSPDVRIERHLAHSFAGGVVAILRAGDFDIAIADHVFTHGTKGPAGILDGVIESGGEEAGFEAIAAQDGLLTECEALDCEEFLGVGGTVTGDGVGFEIRDLIEFFEAHDGEGSTAEGVFDEGVFRVKGEIEIGHWLRIARLHNCMRGEGRRAGVLKTKKIEVKKFVTEFAGRHSYDSDLIRRTAQMSSQAGTAASGRPTCPSESCQSHRDTRQG